MFLISDDYFYQTLDIIQNKVPIHLQYNQFLLWAKEEYGIEPINIIFDQDNNKMIILLYEKDYNRLIQKNTNFDVVNEKIKNRIQSFFRKNLGKDTPVSIINFEQEIKIHINWKAVDKAERLILSKYPDLIWKVYAQFDYAIVFYHSDKFLEQYANSDIEKDIKSIYFKFIKEIDNFNHYSNLSIEFDSKEKVMNEYQGNLYYYALSN